MTTTYILVAVLRETRNGAKWLAYRYAESFGRETGYARSWGCREKRGTGKIWAKAGESLDEAIERRRLQYAE